MTPLATPRSARQAGLSASNSSLLKVVLGLLLVTATVLVSLNASPERILLALDWMAGHRREAVAVFFMAYVIGVVCMMPAMVYDSMLVPAPGPSVLTPARSCAVRSPGLGCLPVRSSASLQGHLYL